MVLTGLVYSPRRSRCAAQRKELRFKLCSFTAIILPSLLISGQAVGSCWTTIGSAGTVDEEDLNTVAVDMNDTGVRSTVANATVNVRYNVVDTISVLGDGTTGPIGLTARLADNGTASQVVVNLRELNVSSGRDTVIASINSNNYPPSTIAQVRTVFVGDIANSDGVCADVLDFSRNIYYLDVSLMKTSLGGTPLIRAINICPSQCIGPPE